MLLHNTDSTNNHDKIKTTNKQVIIIYKQYVICKCVQLYHGYKHIY